MNLFRFIIPKSLVEYITVDSTVRQGFEKMRFHRYVAIPVLDSDGKYVGMLRNDDVLEYFLSVESVDMKNAERIEPMGSRPPRNATAMPLKPIAGTEEMVVSHSSIPVRYSRPAPRPARAPEMSIVRMMFRSSFMPAYLAAL